MTTIEERMAEFYGRAVKSLPKVPEVKPFVVRVESQETSSISFQRPQTPPPIRDEESQVFGVPPATIKEIDPNNGRVEGGSPVSIIGQPGKVFLASAEILFDDLQATDVVLHNPEWLSCKTPAHEVSTVGVTVKVRNIPGDVNTEGSKANGFKYYGAPYITGVSFSGSLVTITGGNFYFATGYAVLVNGILVQASPVGSIPYHQLTLALPVTASSYEFIIINPDYERQRSAPFTAEPIQGFTISGNFFTDAFVFYNYTIRAIRNDGSNSAIYNGTAKLVIYLAFPGGSAPPNIANVTWTPITIPITNGIGSFSMASNPYPAPSPGGSATAGDFYVTAVESSLATPPNYVGYGYQQIHVTQLH